MSRYLDPNVALNRLRNEWQAHGRLIIAFDVDSTVLPFHEHENTDDYEPIRQLLRDLHEQKCILICFTAASPDRWEGIQQRLKEINVSYDFFNTSPSFIPNVVEHGKVYANAYLDDRAGLFEVYSALSHLILERKMEAVNSFFHGMAHQAKRP